MRVSKWQTLFTVLSIACVVVGAGSANFETVAAAQPSWDGWHKAPLPSKIRYEVSRDKVIALTSLSAPCGADTGAMGPLSPLEGKIVKRNFDASGLKLAGIVIEVPSGERLFVNVDTFENLERDNVDLADRGWIVQGLQTLLRQGTKISAQVQLCGASGRLMMLDGVHLAKNARLEDPAATDVHLQSPHKAAKSPEPLGSYVAMQPEGGTFVVPVQINGTLTLNFTIDSGAADVSVPADVVMTLMRTGTLTSADVLDKQTYQLADGSTIPSQRFVIRSLKVGNKVLGDVTGSVAPVKAVPLLGQSFLSRFKSWSIDNTRHVLVLR